MKQYFLLSILSIWGFTSQSVFAQKEKNSKTERSGQETIVIEQDGNNDKTVFEIKDGKVYLDGNMIKDFEPGIELKIIKKNSRGSGGGDKEVFSMEIPDMSDKDYNETKKAFLGVGSAPTMENDGVIVESVTPGSPADAINLNRGDKIKKVDGKQIDNPEDLVKKIGEYKPGDKVSITFEQEGKEVNKDVVLSEKNIQLNRVFRGGPFNGQDFEFNFPNLDDMFKDFRSFGNSSNPNNTSSPAIGIQAEDRADNDGVLVLEVAKGSVAEKAGIKENDVITMFSGKTINSVDDLQNAVSSSQEKKEITLDVKRGKSIETLYMQVPKELKRKQF